MSMLSVISWLGESCMICVFLRASAHGAERVNGLYRQYQRDEGGGWVTNFLETFVKYVFFLGLQHWNLCQHRLLMPRSSNMKSEIFQALRNPTAKHYRDHISTETQGLLSVFIKYSNIQARKKVEHRLLRPLSSNLKSEVVQTSRNWNLLSQYSTKEAREALKTQLRNPNKKSD